MSISTNTIMDELSEKLDICLPVIQGNFVYLDYPVHWNVGDLLIWLGAKKFLKRNKKKPLSWHSIKNIGPRARANISKSDTIIFHGGGNLGDLWPEYQKLREKIIQEYPDKRIVIFPQSVHFDDPGKIAKTCAIFKSHPNLHIFLRDRHSFSILDEQKVPNLKLCPDMAHALWGELKSPSATTADPLYLLRRDKEVGGSLPELEKVQPADWQDLLTGFTNRFYKLGLRIDEADGGKGRNLLPAASLWDAVSHHMVRKAVNLFAPHQTIVTNRLHGMILAALLKKKIVVYDNSYGKLSSYLDCWLSDMPDIILKKI